MKALVELALLLATAQEPKETIVLRTAEGLSAASFPALALPEGEIGVVVGGLSAEAQAGAWKDILGAARWPVVNLGWKDPAPGAGLVTISANVPGATQTCLIQEIAGRKVAFVGVSAPPEGRTPEEAGAPLAALAKALPKDRADLLVLVAAMSRDQAWGLLRSAPGVPLCIASGRGSADPEPLRVGESWIVEGPPRGAWGRLGITLDAQGRVAAVSNRFDAPSGVPSEAVAQAKKKHGLPLDPVRDLRDGAKSGPLRTLPPVLEAQNRACRLRILSELDRAAYGGHIPGAGRKLVVIDAEFENLIPLSLVETQEVPTQYRIPHLGDHLYLLAKGSRLARLAPDADELPGHVPTQNFNLDRLGAKIRGNLVFEVSGAAPERLEIRFYDFAHGHMRIPLSSPQGGENEPDAKPAYPVGNNEILELGVFGFRRAQAAGGQQARSGMTYAMVDLRARSLMTTSADASAFDPKAKPKEKIKIGTVADWKEARKHLHLIADGEYAYPAIDLGELGEAPRFLPDVLTGGVAVFLIPQETISLELRGDFPNAALPDGRTIRPRPIGVVLEGTRPEARRRDPVAEIDDQIFKVTVARQSLVREFSGAKPGAGQAFLVLDLTVRNTGEASECFQTRPQLKYATEKGQSLEIHEATFAGLRAPGELVLVPPKEPRSFQVVFAIPETDRRPRLLYSGVSKAETVNLRPLEAANPEAKKRLCPKCGREAGPKDKFCDDCGTKLNP
jgi:hypothetical protein